MNVEKVMEILRELTGGRAKEILAITIGLDLVRERGVEELIEKVSRIVYEVLSGVRGVVMELNGKEITHVGEKEGVDFLFEIGGGYGMKVYIDDLDDESLELLEYIQSLVSSHVSILREFEVDGLTGALTRRAGEKRLLKLFESGRNFQLVFADLDGLKEINDTFGHEAGDMMLKDFVDSIEGAKLIVRWGGDEFLLVFENGAEEAIKRAKEKYSGKFSYGIVNVPEEAKDLRNAVRLADERMYSMKRSP